MMRSPIFRLPPYTVQRRVGALAAGERMDWGLTLFGIPELWQRTMGQGVRVAVLDTGIDENHPDLKDAILDVRDFTGSRSGPADKQGHGTHVAGTIGARRNELGVVGVAPGCDLLIAKVLGDDGTGQLDWVAEGLGWAHDQGARIASMSLGSPYDSRLLMKLARMCSEAGMLLICAAGNDGVPNSVGVPARYRETIGVAAVDGNKRLATFSSRGAQVDIAAPGVDILSCWPRGGYASLSGTSMATPFVSGVAALMLGAGRDVANVDVLRESLRLTADDSGPAGHDHGFGWGLIDPEEMLEPEEPQPDQPEPNEPGGPIIMPSLQQTLIVNGRETLFDLVPVEGGP
jgi:subtilisin family serine protease